MIRYSRYIALFTSFFVFASMLYSQKEIVIKMTPDGFKQDLSWELRTQDYGTVVASGDLTDCDAFQECELWRAEVEDRCYTFLLRDSAGDGKGDFEVFFGGSLAFRGEDFEYKFYKDFNCSEGETCDNAIVLSLPDNEIFAPDTKEFWFEFTPVDTGFYRINTCLNCPAPAPCADTKLWLYDSCDKEAQDRGPGGAVAYSELSGECAPGSGFNFLPLDGGKTYYVRHKPLVDWTNVLHNDSLQIRFQELPVKFGCTDRSACNFDPFAQVDNGSCEYNVSCAPDLALDEEALRESIEVDTVYNNDECFIEEGCLRGPGAREVIRFSTKIDNVGDADYVVGIPENDTILFNRENCHSHYHHLGYAEYLIYKGEGQPEPVGFKSGFCVLDLDCSDAGGTLPKYLCANMGITQGCSDIYESYLDCQWIDVTDLEDGQYSIVVRVNHFRLADARGMQEKTYDNNAGQACVTIDRSSGKLVVTLDAICPEYEDCLGVPGGEAIIDCNNECGGIAHYGDLDATGELEQGDLDIYFDMLVNKIPLEGPCHDINADGDLSVYDALLVYECLLEKEENINNPFHSHCNFPAGNDLDSEATMLRVSEFNTIEDYIDLEIWVADRNLSGYQLSTAGIVVSDVERLYMVEPDVFLWNNEEIFVMHGTQEFERNTGYEPFVRIHYSEITADSLCVTGDSEFVNNQFDRVRLVLDNACFYISGVNDVEVERSISIIPNPGSNKVAVYANNKFVETLKVLDVNGKTLMSAKVNSEESFEMNVSSLSEGLYLFQLNFKDGTVATERFMKTN